MLTTLPILATTLPFNDPNSTYHWPNTDTYVAVVVVAGMVLCSIIGAFAFERVVRKLGKSSIFAPKPLPKTHYPAGGSRTEWLWILLCLAMPYVLLSLAFKPVLWLFVLIRDKL